MQEEKLGFLKTSQLSPYLARREWNSFKVLTEKPINMELYTHQKCPSEIKTIYLFKQKKLNLTPAYVL